VRSGSSFPLLAGVLLLAIGGMLWLLIVDFAAPSGRAREDGPVARDGAPAPRDRGSEAPLAPRRARPSSEQTVREQRRRIEALTEENLRLSLPFREDVLSSSVRALVPEGQTLVTGGYITADGRHEFTFITPSVSEEGGDPRIRLDSQVVALDYPSAESLGMQTLTTQVRNSMQHAETWQARDVAGTLDAAGNGILSSPVVEAEPDRPFRVELSRPDGTGYELSGRASLADGGGVIVEASVVRREQPVTP